MKRLLSVLLAPVLLLSGCSGTSEKCAAGGAQSAVNHVDPSRLALSEPIYPEFPKEPAFPEDGKDWEAYSEAYNKYIDAILAIRGEEHNLTGGEQSALTAFAARSTPLALAGHEGENAVYSPLSLWSALAMLAQCAQGDSRRQVLDALGTEGVDELQEAVSHIWRTLYTDDGNSTLILGNSIWLNSSAQGNYVQDTLDTLAQKYFAGTYSVPMGSAEADQALTDWVSKQTNGLIGGDQPVFRTRPETLALLASSLYYRAGWTDKFSPELTEEDIFTDAAGVEHQVDFMHQTTDGSFLRREGYQAAWLSTRLGEMVFVLPDKDTSPESLLQDPEFLSNLDFSGEDRLWGEVQWSVPKFDVNSDLELLDTLSALGITDLLNGDKADLTALTDLDAYVSEAKQLARVKVDEEGVEGAAVTIIAVDECALIISEDSCVMDLDRPFLFVIRLQGAPLFVGIVNQV